MDGPGRPGLADRPVRTGWSDCRENGTDPSPQASQGTKEQHRSDRFHRSGPPLRPAGRVRADSGRAVPGLAAGGAGAHGRDHQRAVPHPLPRARGRAVRQRDDHLSGVGGTQRQDALADQVRGRRASALHAAVRGRPGDHGSGHRDLDQRLRGRSRGSQLRLPGAQGDPQGWGSGAAVQAAVVGADLDRGGRGGGSDRWRRRGWAPATPSGTPDGR